MLRPMRGGARRAAWLCDLSGRRVVAKAPALPEPSLRWQLRLEHRLHRLGWITPRLIATSSGALSSRGWTLEPFLDGGPALAADLRALPLSTLHRLRLPPRPGPVRRLPPKWATLAALPGPSGPIHGDLHPGNLLRTPQGLAVLDWEEARLNPLRIDRAAVAGDRADHARAELAACAGPEPARAAAMARHLLARPLTK